jgi:hypothetical protein
MFGCPATSAARPPMRQSLDRFEASGRCRSRVSGPLSRCDQPRVFRPWPAIMPDRPRGLLDHLVGVRPVRSQSRRQVNREARYREYGSSPKSGPSRFDHDPEPDQPDDRRRVIVARGARTAFFCSSCPSARRYRNLTARQKEDERVKPYPTLSDMMAPIARRQRRLRSGGPLQFQSSILTPLRVML